jgi:hypothetical protein
MPVVIIDAQLSMKLSGLTLDFKWPLRLFAFHRYLWIIWSILLALIQAVCMARKPRQIPLRWLHGVSRLMLQGQRQERLARSSQALQARRSRQRQHLARQILEMPL